MVFSSQNLGWVQVKCSQSLKILKFSGHFKYACAYMHIECYVPEAVDHN